MYSIGSFLQSLSKSGTVRSCQRFRYITLERPSALCRRYIPEFALTPPMCPCYPWYVRWWVVVTWSLGCIVRCCLACRNRQSCFLSTLTPFADYSSKNVYYRFYVDVGGRDSKEACGRANATEKRISSLAGRLQAVVPPGRRLTTIDWASFLRS